MIYERVSYGGGPRGGASQYKPFLSTLSPRVRHWLSFHATGITRLQILHTYWLFSLKSSVKRLYIIALVWFPAPFPVLLTIHAFVFLPANTRNRGSQCLFSTYWTKGKWFLHSEKSTLTCAAWSAEWTTQLPFCFELNLGEPRKFIKL